MKFTLLDRIIYRLTARRWNRLISLVLSRHYEKRTIDSRQLHTLAAEFDPTQRSAHKRIVGGELRNREWTTAKSLRRFELGRWRFCLGFGSYAFRIRRDAQRAGSIGFGFGLLTYMKRGEYVPLKTRQT